MKWKKILVICFNVIIAVYLLLAVTAFNKPMDRQIMCNDVRISIEEGVIEGFLTPVAVRNILNDEHINPKGKRMDEVNLRFMEERLNAQELIENAECYKTQDGYVDIRITERVPVMRIMAANGEDYYVDKDGKAMKNTGFACNLTVATGCIDRKYASRVLAPIGKLIIADDFWRSQIEQVNVLPDSTLEMVPRVGNHIVYLGNPTGISKKLQRLRKFYKYGLSQAGWNKYSRISVELHNQIICKKR